jgi:hypothetical protein
MPTSSYSAFDITLHMRPRFTFNYSSSLGLGDAVLNSKSFQRNAARSIPLAHGDNRFICQLGAWIYITLAYSASTLLHHIGHVVVTRSFKKMVRTNAGWIVALVANKQVIIDGAMMQFPGNPVRQLRGWLSTTNTNEAVPPCITTCSPNPARFSFLDVFPKSFSKALSRASDCFLFFITWRAAIAAGPSGGVAGINDKSFAALFAGKLNFIRRDGRLSPHSEASITGFGVPRGRAFAAPRLHFYCLIIAYANL